MTALDAAIEAAAQAVTAHYDEPATCKGIGFCNEAVARVAVEAAMPAIREALAREVNRAKPHHLTRDYTPVDQAWDQAASVVRGNAP